MMPYILQPALEVPEIGQFPTNIIEDAATRAEYALATGGPAYAYQYNAAGLQEMIAAKHWRAQAAFDVFSRIQRQLILHSIIQIEEVFDVENTLVDG